MKAYGCSTDDRCVMQTVQWTESTWPPSHGRNSYIIPVIFSQSSVFSAFTLDDDFGRFQELYEVDSGHYVDEIHEEEIGHYICSMVKIQIVGTSPNLLLSRFISNFCY
jgi:hypothetical protein